MADDQKIRVGVAGVGYLGQNHARIYSELPGCELVGVYDVDTRKAIEVAGKLCCRVFNSIEELGSQCEAASVVVPTDRHHEVSLPLLENGCHLLIEKPICATVAEAEEILAAARRHNRVVQVGHIEHFNPVTSFLESVIDQPRYIVADRLAPFQARGTEVGVVLDLMIHDIGILLQLVKAPVERVVSVGVKVLSNSEDIANARIEFQGGCVANLNASRVSPKKLRQIRVFQPSAYLSMDFMNQSGHFVRKENGELKKEEIPLAREEPLRLELASFLRSLAGATSPKVSGDLGKSALELALTITAQIREKS